MKNRVYVFIFLICFPFNNASGEPSLPSRIGGKLFEYGRQISRLTDKGYVIEIHKKDGTHFEPSATDTNGLNRYDFYDINIPMGDRSNASVGDTGFIHVFKDGVERPVASPPGGKFVIGKSGSIKVINIIIGNAPRAAPVIVPTDGSSSRTIKLNAHNSFYADDRELTYVWEQKSGPKVILSDPTIPDPEFTLPDITILNQDPIIFTLKISNAFGDSVDDTIGIFAQSNKTPRVSPPQKALPFKDTFSTDAFKDQRFTTANWSTFDGYIKLPQVKPTMGAFDPYKSEYQFGSQSNASFAAEIADMDGDGDMDVIIGNKDELNYLYLNNGTSQPFQNVEPKPLGSERLHTYAFAIADINRDGALDIVEACFGCANRLWFNNRSLDPFKDVTPVIFDPSKSNFTTSLVIADINDDHLPDLIVGDRHKVNLLYLNNGTNHPFDNALPITDHENATTSLKLCDVDQDEDLDLIEGNFNEPNVLYLNQGWPDYFSETIPVNTNLDDTQSIALGDMNNDGLIDLMVGNFEEEDRLFFNTQDRIPFSEESATFIGNDFTQTLAVHIHDLNGDGYLDIITAGFGANLMYINNGTASPFENVTAVEITSDLKTRDLALADLDGDFDVDMIEVNQGQLNMLYINNAISGFTFISDQRNCTYQIDFADMDNDGDLDMIEGNYGKINHLFLNNGTASPFMGDRGMNITTAAKNTISISIGDVNQDSFPDMVSGNYNQMNKLYLNSGPPDFFTTSIAIGNLSDKTRYVTLADINGDTYLDLLVGNDGINYIYYNNPQQSSNPYSGVQPVSLSTERNCTNFLMAVDMNKDGYTDIVAGNSYGKNKLYLNNQNGGFIGTDISTDENDTQILIIYDIDNDNDLDIIAGNYDSRNRLYLNNGDQTFIARNVTPNEFYTQSLTLGDINNDQQPDLIVGTYDANNSIYLNNGNLSFLERTSPLIIPSGIHETMDCELRDLDMDGDLDLIEANSNHMNWLHMNNGNGASFFTGTESVYQNLNQNMAVVSSLEVDHITSGNIPKVVLRVKDDLEYNTHIDYYLSNNGGKQYFQVQPDISFIFPTQGNDLRWRARLTSLSPARTPKVDEILLDVQQMHFSETFSPLTIEKNSIDYKIEFSLCEYIGTVTIEATSSNQLVIPDNNIEGDCNGGDCYLLITPQHNITEDTVIMITAADESGSAYTQFTVSVEDACPLAISSTNKTYEDQPVNARLHAEGGSWRRFFIPDQGDKGQAIVTQQSLGDFTFTPHPDLNGTNIFYFTVENDNCDISTGAVTIDIIPVNDPPSFNKGDDLTILSHGVQFGPQAWADNISYGHANESDQILTFEVTTDDADKQYFQDDGLPNLSSDGHFSCFPKPNVEATIAVHVKLTDNGKTENGGKDTSETVNLSIQLQKVFQTLNLTSAHGTVDIKAEQYIKPDTYKNTIPGNVFDVNIGNAFPDPFALTLVHRSSVTLKANPHDGFRFVRWIIDGVTHINNPISLEMNQNKTIVAAYTNQYTLKIDRQGDYGNIKVNDQLISLPFEQSFSKNSDIRIEALNQNLWSFIAYDGSIQSQQNIINLSMMSDQHIVATFKPFLKLSISSDDDTAVFINNVSHPLPYTNDSLNKGDILQLAPVQKQLFSHWSVDNHYIKEPVLSFTMDTNKAIVLHLNTVNISLTAGWNLISIPVIPYDNKLLTLFPDAKDAYLYKNGTYIKTSSIPTGLGVWVNVPEEQSYTIGGQLFVTNNQKLNPGWVLVGMIHKETRLTCNPPDAIDIVYQYKNGTFQEVPKEHKLIPKYGYFLRVVSPCSISLE